MTNPEIPADAVEAMAKAAIDFQKAVLGANPIWGAASIKAANDAFNKSVNEYRSLALSARQATAPGGEIGWIVGSADGRRWRHWHNGSPKWVDTPEEATRYTRRCIAEAVHREDEDAWTVTPYAALSTPSASVERATIEREVRTAIINTPETAEFMAGVPIEAAHQRERWGSEHDAGKSPFDWFWLIGYLSQKAADAATRGDADKAMHHTISTAAALANWHLALSGGDNLMRPGIDEPAAIRRLADGEGATPVAREVSATEQKALAGAHLASVSVVRTLPMPPYDFQKQDMSGGGMASATPTNEEPSDG